MPSINSFAQYPPHILAAMKQKNIGMYELAKKTGISFPTLARILRGKPCRSNILQDAAQKQIAKALGIPVVEVGRV